MLDRSKVHNSPLRRSPLKTHIFLHSQRIFLIFTFFGSVPLQIQKNGEKRFFLRKRYSKFFKKDIFFEGIILLHHFKFRRRYPNGIASYTMLSEYRQLKTFSIGNVLTSPRLRKFLCFWDLLKYNNMHNIQRGVSVLLVYQQVFG